MGGQEFSGTGSEDQCAVAGIKHFEKTPSSTLSKVGWLKHVAEMAACFFYGASSNQVIWKNIPFGIFLYDNDQIGTNTAVYS